MTDGASRTVGDDKAVSGSTVTVTIVPTSDVDRWRQIEAAAWEVVWDAVRIGDIKEPTSRRGGLVALRDALGDKR